MYQGKFQKAPKGDAAVEEINNAPAQPMPQKKHRGKTGTIVFYSLLLVYILLFCIAMGIVMKALNNWLVRFEASQPTAKCQAVFSQLFEDPDWEQLYELSNESGDITAETYAEHMAQKVGDQQLTYIETSAGLSGDKKYIVRCGSEKVATFTLCNNAPNADIPDWQLGTLEIFYSIPRFSITLMAPPEYTVLVDGRELDESHVIRTVNTKAESYLPAGVHGYRMNEMAVHELLKDPEVQILDATGNPVEVHYDSQSRCYRVEAGSPEITEEHRQTLVTAAETYCKYMIGAASRTALRNCFDSQSEIYRTVTANTTWMQSYASYQLGEAQIADYYCYSEEYFSAKVSLKIDVTRKNGTVKEYELENTFFVKKAGNEWLIWEMINSNPQETVTNVRLTFISEDQMLRSELVDAESTKLTLPEVTAPEGKTFAGWFTQTVNESGSTTMELVFEPSEDNTVRLSGTVLEPMTLYALFQ